MKHTTRIDARTIKTKQRIQETLHQMIMQYKYGQVTVSELARQAKINRKTFYLHYDTIESAFDELATNMAHKIGNLSTSHIESILRGDYAAFFTAYEKFLSCDEDFHKRLFCEPSYRSLNQQIQDRSCEALLETLKDASPTMSDDAWMKIVFIAYGVNGIRRRAYMDTGSAPDASSSEFVSKLASACWSVSEDQEVTS